MATALLDDFGRGDAGERAESWRYSRNALRALEQQDYAGADTETELPPSLHAQFDWPQTRGRRIVVVNGAFSERHSDYGRIGASVTAGDAGGNTYAIRIDGDVDQPLHVVYASLPSAQPSRWSTRVAVVVERGRACMIEQVVGGDGAAVVGSLQRQLALGAGTRLDLVSLCELPESVALYRRLDARVAENASLRTTHVLLGSRLQRLDLDVELAGAQARFESRGVFALRGRAHADTHLDVRHAARDTACDVVWRGVADGRARGIFHGAITVAAGADGSDAQLSNKNLLLSPQAEIDTKPVLEIHADEVKAAHGATVGRLDERASFYLRSRGIPLAEARRMLVVAFCQETLGAVDGAELRERLAQRVQMALPTAD